MTLFIGYWYAELTGLEGYETANWSSLSWG